MRGPAENKCIWAPIDNKWMKVSPSNNQMSDLICNEQREGGAREQVDWLSIVTRTSKVNSVY